MLDAPRHAMDASGGNSTCVESRRNSDLGETFVADENGGDRIGAIDELRTRKQWVCWKYEHREGSPKPTKPPVNAITGFRASHSKPSDWTSYERATEFAKRRGLPGVGYVITEDDGITGIDLDDCRDPDTGTIEAWASEIIALGETYFEVSPSGRGLRALARGKIEATVKCDPAHVEIYRDKRYLTITEQQLDGTPDDIRPAPETIKLLLARVEQFRSKPAVHIPTAGGHHPQPQQPRAIAPRNAPQENRSPGGYFRRVNEGALANLSAWVPQIFSRASLQPGTGGYRVSSKELGRNLQEDLSFTPGGIVDFGVADMGDANQGKRTAIDIVIEWGGAADAIQAAEWLCGHLGVTPEGMGWTDDPDGLRESGDAIADALDAPNGSVAAKDGPERLREAPRPLFRELPPASSYPIDALGSILAPAANAIADRIRCPEALAAQSVLAAASLAVQAHADVKIPATGHVKPTSLHMISIAPTGERKTAADGEALSPVREREKVLHEDYKAEIPEYLKLKAAYDAAHKKALEGKGDDRDATKSKLDEVGDAPMKPLEPMLTCGEPTFEGLCKLLAAGQPAMGIFSDEGGSFIGGHGMSPDSRLRTAAGLSGIWDGSTIKRVRSLDGSSVIAGKRVALHLMAQPEAAAQMLTDPVLQDQGFLSRLLVSAPASTAGTRFQREPDPASAPALSRYHARILSILEREPTLALESRNELEPRVLVFSSAAASSWREYADHVERLLAPGQPFEPIRGFANKLPEHAARIAAVLTLVDNIGAQHIDDETFERAVRLAEHYTQEALRLFGAGYASPGLRRAEALRNWLLTKWKEPLVSVRAVVTFGPNSIRDTATAKAAIKILGEHGWLVGAGSATVDGKHVKEAWKIVKEGGQ